MDPFQTDLFPVRGAFENAPFGRRKSIFSTYMLLIKWGAPTASPLSAINLNPGRDCFQVGYLGLWWGIGVCGFGSNYARREIILILIVSFAFLCLICLGWCKWLDFNLYVRTEDRYFDTFCFHEYILRGFQVKTKWLHIVQQSTS